MTRFPVNGAFPAEFRLSSTGTDTHDLDSSAGICNAFEGSHQAMHTSMLLMGHRQIPSERQRRCYILPAIRYGLGVMWGWKQLA